MNRRDALKLMTSTAGGLVTGGGLLLPKYAAGAPLDFYSDSNNPIYAGWVNNKDSRKRFIEAHRYPFLRQQMSKIKGTGKGKKVLLWKLFEQVTGRPLVPHYQTIGDCYYAGTLVTMADGSRKKIEQIKVGDSVLTHRGTSQKVVRFIRKPYNKHMIRFQAEGCLEDIVCTPDHKFLVNGGIWKAAGILSLSDSVYVQKYQGPAISKSWDLLDILPTAEVKEGKLRAKGSSKWVNRFVTLDADLAYVFGAYLAEGGCTQTKTGTWCKVDFNLGVTETNFAVSISTCMKRIFGISCAIYSVPSKPTVKYVRCQSKAVAEFFKHLLPGNTYTKEVPKNILTASKEIQKACLLGWLEGDGSCLGRKNCRSAVNRGPRCSGISVSKNLILSMFRLANYCNLTPTTQEVKVQKNRATAYRIQFNVADTAKLYPEVAIKNYATKTISSLGLERKLQKISTISKVATTVYCLEVAGDHSFIANGYSGSNCVSHACGLSIDILTAVRILMHGHLEKWVAKTATEIIYAGSRIEIGNGRLKKDGSVGVWAAEFVRQWGVLLRQKYLDHDFTTYDGQLARSLGKRGVGVPDELEPLCKLHPVKTSAIVSSWEECRDAVANGYPVSMCSNIGFTSRRDRSGFLRRSRRPWYHAMAIIGIDDEYRRPGALIQNSWGGDVWVSGPKRHEQPDGSFWCDASTIDSAMKQGDSVAFSGYVGYPRNDIPDYVIF